MVEQVNTKAMNETTLRGTERKYVNNFGGSAWGKDAAMQVALKDIAEDRRSRKNRWNKYTNGVGEILWERWDVGHDILLLSPKRIGEIITKVQTVEIEKINI